MVKNELEKGKKSKNGKDMKIVAVNCNQMTVKNQRRQRKL